MKPLTTIEVDEQVLGFLQEHATPFVDTPNDVLRRLLLEDVSKKGREPAMRNLVQRPVSSDEFVWRILRENFGEEFTRRSPYRMMFESKKTLCYFQNFNKESNHLWYRVTEKPWGLLTAYEGDAWLCLTNPAEGYAYVIPVREVQKRAEQTSWNRPYLEINIDPSTSRWTEFDWKLDRFLKRKSGE